MMKCKCSHVVYLWFFVLFVHAQDASTSSINVSLGFLAPLDEALGPLSTLGQELESAFKLAVADVNKNAHSSGIRIRAVFSASVKDETINPEEACKYAADYFAKDDNYIGIVGGYYSSCSAAIQKQLKILNLKLPHISYRSTSIDFLDHTEYPNFYHSCSNNKQQANVVVDLIKHFRWTRAAIIHADDLYYGKELSDEIVSKAKLSNVYIMERVSFLPGSTSIVIDDKLQMIKSSGSRVNIIVAQGKDVFTIFKRIKAKNMYGEGWVWICTDGASSLYLAADNNVNVTAEGLVGIAPAMFSGKSLLNIIVSWFSKAEYPGQIWKSKTDPAISPFVGQVFQAVSLYGSILGALVKEKNLTTSSSGSDIRTMVLQKLRLLKSRKTGMPSVYDGPLFFNEQNDGLPVFTITNYISGQFKSVGSWNGKMNGLSIPAGAIIWPGGSSQTPTDRGKPGKALFRIGFVAPLNSKLGVLSEYGKELRSAFKVAIDVINNDNNYQIELDGLIKDEGVDGVLSCEKATQEMMGTNLVAIVGAYRSQCSMKIHDSLAANSKKIPIISYASTSKLLSNKLKYKYFFRVVPSNQYESEVLRQLLRKYAFKEVSTLYSSDVSSSEIARDFEGLTKNDTTPITVSQQFPQNSNAKLLRTYVEKVRKSGSRVVLVSALPNDVSVIQQIVKELKMAGRGWIWLGSDGATTKDFPLNSDVAQIMNGMLGVNPVNGEGPLYFKMLSNWMTKDKLKYPGVIHNTASSSLPYTAQVFDAVNGIATALSDLISRKRITHKSDTKFVRELLYNKLKTYNNPSNGYLSATGSSSKMYFDKYQNGPLGYSIVNLVGGKWKNIGKYNAQNKLIQFTKDPLFPGGTTIPNVGAGKVIYKIAALFPKHKRLGALSELGLIWESALTAAVNWVNRNDSITVGFDVTVFDTGVSSLNCVDVAKRIPSNIDIVIGAARSDCTDSIYRVINKRGTPMLTYASTSSVLSKKSFYPNLFRMCPADNTQAEALAELIEKYAWDKIGIVAASGIYGQELSADIKNLLKRKAISITTVKTFKEGSDRMTETMAELKRSGSGVNLIIANTKDAVQLYQEAVELGMVGKGWTWLGSDGASSTIFKRSQNLQQAMQGMVGFRPNAGSGKHFDAVFSELLQIHPAANRETAYLPQVFDSVLFPALMLHRLHKQKKITAATIKISARTILMNEMRSMSSIKNSFQSTSGKPLYFDYHQDTVPAYDLVNLNGERGYSWITVGNYENGELDIISSVVWPGGTVAVPPSNAPTEPKDKANKDNGGGTSKGLIALAVVFSIFGLLVIVFMIYIVQRVRYRHLYMQSDLNQGGVFSVLYGHNVNRTGTRLNRTNGNVKGDTLESAVELTDPMMPRHL